MQDVQDLEGFFAEKNEPHQQHSKLSLTLKGEYTVLRRKVRKLLNRKRHLLLPNLPGVCKLMSTTALLCFSSAQL